MRIGNNISAMNTLNRLSVNNSQLSKSLEKLSSGSAINRAADDAAGLAISEKMRAQIAGLEQASKNAQDGISLVQTAEGALDQTHTALRRMETLAMKATNGTITAEDRAKIQAEVDERTNEIDRVAETSNFNGIKLFDGSMGTGTTGAEVHVAQDTTRKTEAFDYSISGEEGITVKFAAGDGSAAPNGVTATWNNNELTLTVTSTAGTNVITQKDIDNAIRNASGAPDSAKTLKVTLKDDITFGAQTVAGNITGATGTTAKAVQATATGNDFTVIAAKAGNDQRSITFATTGTVGVTKAANGNITVGLEAGKEYTASEINKMLSDADAGMTVSFDGKKQSTDIDGSDTTGSTILTLSGGAGLSSGGGLQLQIGASADDADKITVQIGKMDTASLLGTDTLDMSTPDAANAAITKINAAIEKVSEQRAGLGATQNRLEQTIENLSTTAENMSAAESRIRDVDMAKEMTNFTKFSILSQASQAMLAQANALPQGVLQLLG